jgi:hypothetical protein
MAVNTWDTGHEANSGIGAVMEANSVEQLFPSLREALGGGGVNATRLSLKCGEIPYWFWRGLCLEIIVFTSGDKMEE